MTRIVKKVTFGCSAHPQVDLLGNQVAHAFRTQREVALQLLDRKAHDMRMTISIHTCLHTAQAA